MEMLFAEGRRAQRRSVLIDCQVVRERDFSLIGERAVDLSPHGMLLCASGGAKVGEDLIVTFRVPGTKVWVDTTATVVRVVHGRRPGDRAPALGLSFHGLTGEEDRLVRAALVPFPPILPARPRRVDYAATAALIALS